MRVSYVVHDAHPVSVQIELVREEDSAVIARWTAGVVAPETPQTVQWNGLAGGRSSARAATPSASRRPTRAALRATSAQSVEPAPPGARPRRCSCSCATSSRSAARTATASTAPRFGGGRGHQGQDVFADCGTPLVAARGGTVKLKQYHSAAGHYLVIDGERTGIDYGYMHLREAALVDKGERVRTGQLLGYVGDTGAPRLPPALRDVEAPGWYSGGSALDPLPS